jgi:hypothetical protein
VIQFESIEGKVRDLLESIDLVFDQDWDYTRLSINDSSYVKGNGTFLNPYPGEHYVGGAGDNWGNRSAFLAAYRDLKGFAISEGILDIE